MANQDLRDSQFGAERYRNTRDWLQPMLLSLRDNTSAPRGSVKSSAAAPAGLLGEYLSQENGLPRTNAFPEAGSEASPAPDPNFRQLSKISLQQPQHVGLRNEPLPATPFEEKVGFNNGRSAGEDGGSNAGRAPVVAGFGQIARPLPWPPFGPVTPLPKPQLPEWWRTLGDLLRIYPMVGSGRFRGGNDDNDEDCVERHGKEESRCFQRYSQGEYAHPDFLSACKERASNRRNLCVGNGGKPRADEPKEWSLKDEEVYRNFGR
jgi:hypothetical protein